jgi:inner membrane protein
MESVSVFDQIKNSQFTRILIMFFLILILLIPTAMMNGLVSERENLRAEAIQNITSTWGIQQRVIGPQLVVPYIKRVQDGDKTKTVQGYGYFLAEKLKIDGELKSSNRHRGIFQVSVYDADINLSGEFKRPDLSVWGAQAEDVQWDNAQLYVGVADAHAIKNQVKLAWNNKPIAFAPGLGKYFSGSDPIGNNSGIHAELKGQMTGDRFSFQIPLQLSGSEKIQVAPMGEVTQVSLKGNWPNPSFQGRWLPASREVDANGFKSTWDIPSLGRNYAQTWNRDAAVPQAAIDESLFGVEFLNPVDNYRMAKRSIDYNFLFLVLMFATFWMFEVISRLRIHPLQYLMVGVAMSMFYMLQIAIAEHLGFNKAYLIATAAVVLLVTAYSISILAAKRRGIIIGVVLVALYTYLYVVLASQDYSLLLGSIGMFIFLAIIMFLTRRVNWFDSSGQRQLPQ